MQTLTKPQIKQKIASCKNETFQVDEKLINSKSKLDFKLYQKLFVVILASFTFLIFPESTQEMEVLCKKYHSQTACMVW